MQPADSHAETITIRTELQPGDLGAIVRLHGVVYAQERGWDATFEAYVAGPLSQFALAPLARQRLWMAEAGGRLVGCIAVVPASEQTAQIRWFLVEPNSRGAGLGRKLINRAVDFSKEQGFGEVVLWTEKSLDAAAHLYRAAGFSKVEEKAGMMWGKEVVEEKYLLKLK